MNLTQTNHTIAHATMSTSYVPCGSRVRWSYVKGLNPASKQEETF